MARGGLGVVVCPEIILHLKKKDLKNENIYLGGNFVGGCVQFLLAYASPLFVNFNTIKDIFAGDFFFGESQLNNFF